MGGNEQKGEKCVEVMWIYLVEKVSEPEKYKSEKYRRCKREVWVECGEVAANALEAIARLSLH